MSWRSKKCTQDNLMYQEAVGTQALAERRDAVLQHGGRAGTPCFPLTRFFQLSLKRMLRAVARLREIAIGTVLHGVGVTVPKLIFHGVVAGLGAFVGLEGTLPAVGIVVQMVADTFRHDRPFVVHAVVRIITRLRYAESWQRAMTVLDSVLDSGHLPVRLDMVICPCKLL